MKRLIALGDTHCGHFAGLTPPGWQFSKTGHRSFGVKCIGWTKRTDHARGLFNVGQRGGHYKAPAEAGAGSLKIEFGFGIGRDLIEEGIMTK